MGVHRVDITTMLQTEPTQNFRVAMGRTETPWMKQKGQLEVCAKKLESRSVQGDKMFVFRMFI